ncbi:MAG: lytic murein transglycosylase [Pseudonocardiaceae bacterium]
MTDQDDQREPQPLLHGRRTRVAVALIGLLFSMGVPVAVLGSGPVPTVDGHPVGSLVDPAGLGVTGALPGDPVTGDPKPGDPVTGEVVPGPTSGALDLLRGDPASIGLPGIPTPPNLPDGPLGIPGVILDAYQFAQRTLTAARPGCHLSWSVLAGIGRIESNHASDGRVDAYGNTLGSILGPRLDGSPGMAAIPDTDHGVLDQDTTWDRAVGPMQFIPSSWRSWGVDGNGDGVANPNNIYDATVATGLYLCAGGANLSDPAQLQTAVFRYNHSAAYVDIVLQWAHAYLTGVVPVPSAPGPVPPGTNGNGGLPTVPDVPLVAAPPPAAALALPPTPTTSASPAPPSVTPSPPLVTTSNPPSPQPTTTASPPPETPAPGTTSSSAPPAPPTTTPAVTATTAPSPPPGEPVSGTPSPPTPTPGPTPTIAPPQ